MRNPNNYRAPRNEIALGHARLAYRRPIESDRSTVRTGGEKIWLKRTRRDGSHYSLPIRIDTPEHPLVRSEAVAIASQTRNGRILRVGPGESFRDA